MQKDPARRYGTVEQFAADMSRHLAGRPVLARPDTLKLPGGEVRRTAYSRCRVRRAHRPVARRGHHQHRPRGASGARAAQPCRAPVQRRAAAGQLLPLRVPRRDRAVTRIDQGSRARRAPRARVLDSLSHESANDASLERELGTAYERIGDVQGLPGFANLGDVKGALKSHYSALTLRQPLAAASSPSRVWAMSSRRRIGIWARSWSRRETFAER